MDDACLHRRHRSHITHDLWQPLEAVTNQKERVSDTPVLHIGQDTHPELRALTTGASPEPQNVLLARQRDPIAA